MVMLHIKLKGITKCSSMVANILPADPSPIKGKYESSNMVADI